MLMHPVFGRRIETLIQFIDLSVHRLYLSCLRLKRVSRIPALLFRRVRIDVFDLHPLKGNRFKEGVRQEPRHAELGPFPLVFVQPDRLRQVQFVAGFPKGVVCAVPSAGNGRLPVDMVMPDRFDPQCSRRTSSPPDEKVPN